MSTSNHNNPSRGPKRPHRLMTAALASIIAAGLLSSTAVAFGATPNPDGSVTVESGDTLSAIAEQFGGDWRDYTGYRSGNPDLIFPGEHVRDTRKAAGTDAGKCAVTIDWAAEAQRTYDGEYGVDPVRHSTLACIASMFVRRVERCFSAVWADGFPRCRHR
ncbi:LysM peptidoglycan-binding domain-containing protein, partial [Bifidobacterium jacchi]|uniref:LysM peptidoglycan-binding domain-containing protein n=1 Tax=Bifidobacterium jacchi TaxID=2490545 RepID=UPI001F4FF50D